MKGALHQRIANHTVIAYVNLLDPLRALYEDPVNPQNIVLEYSLTSIPKTSSSWNREHLWPRSRGDSDQAGPDDSDLFHVVPSDISVNSERGSLYFDESNPADPGYMIPAHPLAPQTSRDSDSWQPPPSQRGDIARALFYMEVRYDGSDLSTTDMELVSFPPSGSQMGNLNTLLLWNEQDPPDDAERRRNDLIFTTYQHNRNPFIDHPEWVQAIWGVPAPNGGGTQPIAQVTALSSLATENPTMPAVVAVSLNQFAGPGGLTVSFSAAGTAAFDDYEITGQNVTFDSATGAGTAFIPENFNTAIFAVVPIADGTTEPNESVVFNINSGTGYTVVPGASATVMVSDNPALPASWNFNSGAPFLDPLPANAGSGSISFAGWRGSVTSFNGTTGQALALVGTAGNDSWIDFNFSMRGFFDLNINFFTRGTASGFTTGTWSYSVDGTNFSVLPGVNTATTGVNFVQRHVDFSSVAVLNDSPNVTLRYTLSGATGTAGNNRIDDFTINATPLITGDQLRTVEVATSDANGSETNSDPGVFSFRINGLANEGGLLVGFNLGGSATPPGLEGADYDISGAESFDPGTRSGTVRIPQGTTTALVRIHPLTDQRVEGIESVIATIQPQPDAYIVGLNGFAIININEPPANDDFADAITLPAGPATSNVTNVGATRESGEPNHAGYAGGASVWWNWNAPSTGSVTISTFGSTIDTLLGVYTGDSVDSLTLVAFDTNSDGRLTSAVRFATTAGTTYRIAVDGFNAASGNIILTVTPSPDPPLRPANDNFAGAIPLSGVSVTASGINDFTTKEIGEPNHAGSAGGKSVWWTWTAANSGLTTISTFGSTFNTLLAVYTGSAVNALSPVASNNNFGSASYSRLTFAATAGVTYAIAVDGDFGSSGGIFLAITGAAPAPDNDLFVNAIELTGPAASATGTNVGATKESGEPNHGNITGGKSVWWRWTAPGNGTFTITTDGSDFDTILGVYTGNAVNALTRIAGDDDSGIGLASKVMFTAVAGTTYSIAVDGFGADSGNITLHIIPPPDPPPNDNFVNAIVLNGNAPVTTGTNAGATKETGEPNHAGNGGGHSVWWRWTAPADGYAAIATAGSDFDTLLAVYTGTAVDALTLIAANDQTNNSNQSQVAFAVTAGVTYHIAVDGWFGDEGNIVLAVNPPLPVPDASIFTFDNSANEATNDFAFFGVFLSAAQPYPVTVAINIGGTATPQGDYELDTPVHGRTASITFGPTETFKIVTVTPLNDNHPTEFDETITLSLIPTDDYGIIFGTAADITLHDNTPYTAAWAQQYGPGFAGPRANGLADYNHNGLVNLLEFAFNGGPVAGTLVDQNNVPLQPLPGFVDFPDPNNGNMLARYPTISFNRRTDAPWLLYVVQQSSTLDSESWDETGVVMVSTTTAGMPPGVERVTFRSTTPVTADDSANARFLRVMVTALVH